MSRLLYALREVIWSAVLAVAFAALAIIFAVVLPASLGLTIAFASASITSALLAQRA